VGPDIVRHELDWRARLFWHSSNTRTESDWRLRILRRSDGKLENKEQCGDGERSNLKDEDGGIGVLIPSFRLAVLPDPWLFYTPSLPTGRRSPSPPLPRLLSRGGRRWQCVPDNPGWIWVIFYIYGYVNRKKVIPDRYNGFRYSNYELVPVYLCTQIKLYIRDYFIVFCILKDIIPLCNIIVINLT
jgi:hypothetical protein